MNDTIRTLLAAALVATAAAPAAQAMTTAGNAAAATTEMTAGEVRKVDKAAGRVTIKHGDIKNLQMPAMTMVFVARDKALLDGLKPGDKIRFSAIAEKDNTLVVTAIQPAH